MTYVYQFEGLFTEKLIQLFPSYFWKKKQIKQWKRCYTKKEIFTYKFKIMNYEIEL